jgi:hypothetical protein
MLGKYGLHFVLNLAEYGTNLNQYFAQYYPICLQCYLFSIYPTFGNLFLECNSKQSFSSLNLF